MLSLTRVFRRLYATTVPDGASALSKHAAAAREQSTPHAVRLRRLRKQDAFKPPSGSDLTPSEFSRYQRFLAKGELVKEDGNELTEGEWLGRLNERRTRLRGLQYKEENGTKELKVVGQKIYLPNIVFRMVRNHTPTGQPYNPYEATFRIPQSVTKTDVRSYLSAVYGVKTTYIRTTNYLSPIYRDPHDGSWTRTKSYKTYKRAVVGLVDPFYYPLAMEDMDEGARKERQKWLEEKFALSALKRWRRYEYLRMTKKGSKNWRFTGYVRRDKILKEVAKRRLRTVRETEQIQIKMDAMRTQGVPIVRSRQRKVST
ncbi:hypothetical protein SERLA73DRAFT_187317 [Serpula lacrymans var. lacrymans S7.3]|uniref:Large ribosomal subunit protein uL23m n=2 Tax=Serpula lacrymans var. lacrymans TaxID=341189 RepID=F8Q8X8_SERL3|nr:uncharacterized protein SERLADRAFT_476792 [Serpula lacrymans var. lacrymans S7.9]EGN95033.1 hypothetical protein SERLA73DRAFT_187317 [Serpula lacrymans var. lacrymans S7.3]EGO20525.1 hypothetical protein SERLADRAFT_476792 [Serpula lacrymans var. lacrymans S7.9]